MGGHGGDGYRDGKPAGNQLLEEVLIEGEGVTAHILKIRLNGPLMG